MPKVEYRILLLLVIVRLVFSGALIALFFDGPGDGPNRIVIASNWLSSIELKFNSPWPPGYTLITGPLMTLLGGDANAVRIVNAVFGAATIPLIYAVCTFLGSSKFALASAALFALFPFFIAISATGLTETLLLFFTFGILVLVFVSANERRVVALPAAGLSVACALGALVRYEIWMVIVVAPVFVLLKTKSPKLSSLTAVLVGIGPCFWLLGNWLDYGTPLAFLSGPLAGAAAVGLEGTRSVLAERFIPILSVPILLAALLGLTLTLVYGRHRETWSPERICYAILTVLVLGFTFWFAEKRGESLWPRNLVMAVALLLPFVAACMTALVRLAKWAALQRLPRRVRQEADGETRVGQFYRFLARALVAFLFISPWLSYIWVWTPALYLQKVPKEIEAIAGWLKSGEMEGVAVLATRIGWQATTIHALALPEKRSLYIISNWSSPEATVRWISANQPQYLITSLDENHAYLEEVAAVYEAEVDWSGMRGADGVREQYIVLRLPSFTPVSVAETTP